MRCLVLSSLLLLFCSQSLFAQHYMESNVNLRPLPKFESMKYKASIDVIGKHLSGILIFKTQEDSSVRAVFVNEMGVTFFDITFLKDSYLFNSIMNSLDKKPAKLSLAKDLGMILMRGIFKSESIKKENCQIQFLRLNLKRKGYVSYFPNENWTTFPTIINFGKREKKIITITQNYTQENSLPDSIFVQHHTVNFTISLKKIDVTE